MAIGNVLELAQAHTYTHISRRCQLIQALLVEHVATAQGHLGVVQGVLANGALFRRRSRRTRSRHDVDEVKSRTAFVGQRLADLRHSTKQLEKQNTDALHTYPTDGEIE